MAHSSSSSGDLKISLPDKFDGTHHKFQGFINQVHLVFCPQASYYPSDDIHVGFVGTLLSGPPLDWFATLLEKGSTHLQDFDSFLQVFHASYGDLDKAQAALTKICTLAQGTCAASGYASDFQLISCDLAWGEVALIDQLCLGL